MREEDKYDILCQAQAETEARDFQRWTDEVECLCDTYAGGEFPWCPFTDHPVVPEGTCLTWNTCKECVFFQEWLKSPRAETTDDEDQATASAEKC